MRKESAKIDSVLIDTVLLIILLIYCVSWHKMGILFTKS